MTLIYFKTKSNMFLNVCVQSNLMTQTRQDLWCEFYPSIGSRDTLPDHSQGMVHTYVLFVSHGKHVLITSCM